MNSPPLLFVLLAVCESVGLGLIGVVVLRLLRPFPVVVSFVSVIVITVIAMVVSTVVLLGGYPPQRATIEPAVVCVAGIVSIGTGLLLGAFVLRDRQQLVEIRTDVQRLAGEVNDLFALSRIQAGAVGLNRSEVALEDLVGEAVAEVSAVAAERGVRVWAGWVESAVVSIDSAGMARAINNLLVRAIDFSRDGGTVSVDAWASEPWATVSVRGECEGMLEKELASMLETGWHGEEALGADRGTDLQLAIAEGIVQAHQGEFSVRNIPGGCRFEARLPVAART